MDDFEIAEALDDITLLIDTREQDTRAREKRIAAIGWNYEREKLDFGDYSVKAGGISFANEIAIERKMSLDEIAGNYTRGRGRFEREFERAKEAGARIYVLVEGASWERIYAHDYRSKFSPQAFTASLLAYQARYDCRIVFCSAFTAPYIIREILYREAKERLKNYEKTEL